MTNETPSAREQMRTTIGFMLSGDALERGKEVADKIALAINSMSLNPNAVAVGMGNEHKTLQQTFTGICFAWIKYLALDERMSNLADGRNAASIERCKSIWLDLCYHAQVDGKSETDLLDPLPFI